MIFFLAKSSLSHIHLENAIGSFFGHGVVPDHVLRVLVFWVQVTRHQELALVGAEEGSVPGGSLSRSDQAQEEAFFRAERLFLLQDHFLEAVRVDESVVVDLSKRAFLSNKNMNKKASFFIKNHLDNVRVHIPVWSLQKVLEHEEALESEVVVTIQKVFHQHVPKLFRLLLHLWTDLLVIREPEYKDALTAQDLPELFAAGARTAKGLPQRAAVGEVVGGGVDSNKDENGTILLFPTSA